MHTKQIESAVTAHTLSQWRDENLRLAAVNADLLAALREIVDALDERGDDGALANRARAAIAKATT